MTLKGLMRSPAGDMPNSECGALSPLAAEGEGLQRGDLRGLGRLIDEHSLKGVWGQPLEDPAAGAGQSGEHHLGLHHKGELQLSIHLHAESISAEGPGIVLVSSLLHFGQNQTQHGSKTERAVLIARCKLLLHPFRSKISSSACLHMAPDFPGLNFPSLDCPGLPRSQACNPMHSWDHSLYVRCIICSV